MILRDIMKKIANLSESSFLKLFFTFFSLAFLVAAFCMPDRARMFTGLWNILSQPSKISANYFAMGGYAATFLNMGLVGLFCLLLFLLQSCTVDYFEDNKSEIVVEGWIEDNKPPIVILSKTLTLSDEYQSLTDLRDYIVTWAKVSVSDGVDTVVLTGKYDPEYFPSYIYTTGRMFGRVGATYTLKVEYDDYYATDPSAIDDLLKNKSDSSHHHNSEYETIANASAKLTEAKKYTDEKVSPVSSTLSTHTANGDIHVTAAQKTNWNTAYTHSQSSHAPVGAQVNIIETVKVNGTALTPSNKAVNITVPTKASDINAEAAGNADKALTSAKSYTDLEIDFAKQNLL